MESNIRKYYAFNFLFNLVFWLPFYVLYFLNLGLSLTQIMIIHTVFSLFMILFEVPSGYLADRIGRKVSMLIGIIFATFGVFLLFLMNSFVGFLIAQLFSGIGFSMISGADVSLLYDTLKSLKKEHLYKKISGKAFLYSEVALVLSALIGSFLVTYGIRATFLASIVTGIISFFIVLSMREPKLYKEEEFKIKSSSKLVGFFIYGFFIIGISTTIFRFYQPYFKETGLPLFMFGVAFAVFSLVSGYSSYKAHKIEEKLGVYRTLILLPLIMLVSIIFVRVFWVWFGFIFFLLREFVRGMYWPVLGDYVHKLVGSSRRATAMSVMNLFANIGAAIFSIILGYVADIYSLKIVFTLMVVILLIGLIMVIFLLRMRK